MCVCVAAVWLASGERVLGPGSGMGGGGVMYVVSLDSLCSVYC